MACEIVTAAQLYPDLVFVDFATGSADVEVGSQGAAVGSDIQMCDPDGSQKGPDEGLAPARASSGKIR